VFAHESDPFELDWASNFCGSVHIADEGFYLMNPQDLEQEKGEVTAPRNQNIYLGIAHLEV
jgi:hypothetical protein